MAVWKSSSIYSILHIPVCSYRSQCSWLGQRWPAGRCSWWISLSPRYKERRNKQSLWAPTQLPLRLLPPVEQDWEVSSHWYQWCRSSGMCTYCYMYEVLLHCLALIWNMWLTVKKLIFNLVPTFYYLRDFGIPPRYWYVVGSQHILSHLLLLGFTSIFLSSFCIFTWFVDHHIFVSILTVILPLHTHSYIHFSAMGRQQYQAGSSNEDAWVSSRQPGLESEDKPPEQRGPAGVHPPLQPPDGSISCGLCESAPDGCVWTAVVPQREISGQRGERQCGENLGHL